MASIPNNILLQVQQVMMASVLNVSSKRFFFIIIISIFCIKRIVHLNFLRSGGHLGERL